MASLLPNIPEEIRAARIGTCYDPLRRKLMQNKIAIDPGRLNSNTIQAVQGAAKLKLRADSSTSKNASSTFFALDSKFKYGSWVSAGFNMEMSKAEASASESLNCYCSYIFEKQILQLMDNGAKALFNCMTDEFQTMFTELADSANSTGFFVKYIKFLQTFGHGCVTKLMLTSGSAFVMTAKYSSTSSAMKSKYGANLAINTPWGVGGSVASEFAKEAQNTDSAASLDIQGESIPENTPTAGWCNDLMKSLMAQGLSKLAANPGLISADKITPPKAPEIPKGEPTKKDPPKASDKDISKEMQEKLMKDDGFKGTWKEYMEAQKKEYEKIKPAAVTMELCENRERLLAMESTVPDPPHPIEPDELSAAWDLGGYIPYSYEITPWSELFAGYMKGLALPTTFTSIYIAKTYVFYLTQMQFASYLYFLSDVGPGLSKNENIVSDAKMFAGFCGELLDNISSSISSALAKDGGKFTNDDYEKIVAAFEKRINDMDSAKRFFSTTTRIYFFYNYKFLMEMAAGCVFVIVYDDGTRQYITEKVLKTFTKQMSIATALKDAWRVYPCLEPMAGLRPAIYDRGFRPVYKISRGLSAERKFDESGRLYYLADNTSTAELDMIPGLDTANIKERRHYPASFTDMKDAVSIFGGSMITDFDFDSILDFANPERDIT